MSWQEPSFASLFFTCFTCRRSFLTASSSDSEPQELLLQQPSMRFSITYLVIIMMIGSRRTDKSLAATAQQGIPVFLKKNPAEEEHSREYAQNFAIGSSRFDIWCSCMRYILIPYIQSVMSRKDSSCLEVQVEEMRRNWSSRLPLLLKENKTTTMMMLKQRFPSLILIILAWDHHHDNVLLQVVTSLLTVVARNLLLRGCMNQQIGTLDSLHHLSWNISWCRDSLPHFG